MGGNLLNGPEAIKPGTLTRALLNTATAGSAVIAKILLGAGLSMTSTGADAGTGDVTLTSTVGIVPGQISGLGLSNDTTTPNTVIDIAAGSCAANDGVNLMTLGSTITKTTGAWAVGSGSGGLDTGTVAASTWYHLHVIKRLDTSVTDVLISLSATAPTLPTNYTAVRRIGSIRTNASSNIVAFTQNGNEFLWTVPSAEIATGGTLAASTVATYTALVPTGVKVNALISGYFSGATGNTQLAIAPVDVGTPVVGPNTVGMLSAASVYCSVSCASVRTNTSGQFNALANFALSAITLGTAGWIDPRGSSALTTGSGGSSFSGGGAPSASVAISTATTLDATHSGKQIILSGATTLTLGAATRVAGWSVWIRKTDAPLVGTITPSSGTIDGQPSIKVYNEEPQIYWDPTTSTYLTSQRQRGWVSAGSGTVTSGAASLPLSFFAGDTEIRDVEIFYDNYVPSASSDINLTANQGTASSFYGSRVTFGSGSLSGGQITNISPQGLLGGSQTLARSGTLRLQNIQNTAAYAVSFKSETVSPSTGAAQSLFLCSSTAGALASVTLTPTTGTITSCLYDLKVFRL